MSSTVALVLGGVIALALLFWVGLRAVRGEYVLHDLFFVERDGGATLWANERRFDNVGSLRVPQLAILNVADGSRRVVWTGKDDEVLVLLVRAKESLFWWSSVSGLHTRDSGTGALLLDERAILAKATALEGKLVARGDYNACNNYVGSANGIRIRTNDARVWTLGFDLVARPAETPWVEVDIRPQKYASSALSQSVTLRSGRDVSMDGKDRRTLRVGKEVVGEEEYLDSEIVRDTDAGGVVELADPPSVLVAHRDKLGSGAKRLLSRVTLEGKNVWTRSEAEYAVKSGDQSDLIAINFATSRDDGVYVAFGARRYTVLAIDPKTGDAIKRVPK